MKRRDFVALGAAIPAAAGWTLVSKTQGADGQEITAELGEIGVLGVRPGDLVVVTIPGRISEEAGRNLTAALEAVLPNGVKAIALSEGAQLGVIRSDA